MSNTEKAEVSKSYLGTYFKKLYFALTLLFSALALTAMIFNEDFNLINQVHAANRNAYIFVIIAAALVLLALFIYIVVNFKNKSMTVADAIIFAFILTGILSALYFYFFMNYTGWKRYAVSGALFLLGVVLWCIRAKKFKSESGGQIVYTSNTLIGYYSTIVKKYSLLSVLCVFFLMIVLGYMLCNESFSKLLDNTLTENPAITVLLAVTGVFILIYACFAASDKKINPLDVLLFGLLFALPVMLVENLLINKGDQSGIPYWAAGFGVLIFVTFIRYLNYDLLTEANTQTSNSGKVQTGFIAYFKNLFSKYNVFLILAVAGLIISALAVVIGTDALSQYAKYIDGTLRIDIRFFLMAILGGSAALALLIGIFTSFATMKCKRIAAGDFFLVLLSFFSLMSYAILFIYSNITVILGLIAFSFFCASILVARVRNVAIPKKIK